VVGELSSCVSVRVVLDESESDVDRNPLLQPTALAFRRGSCNRGLFSETGVLPCERLRVEEYLGDLWGSVASESGSQFSLLVCSL